MKDEYEKSAMGIGKYEVPEPSFFETDYGKAVIFILGLGVGFTASEMSRK